MSVLNQSGEEQVECPLCMEPLEVDDLHFYPCTCGYQICRFCWNRIREGENGLCPACRKAYPENPADFTPLSREQVAAIKTEKKAREQKRRNKTMESRRALANVRVVQNNLVFVVGLPVRLADPEILKRQEYFGKYGKIHKVVINQSTTYAGSQGPSASAYVTYASPADALRAIQGVSNVTLDGRVLKGSLGTTKYCANFMKNQPCPKTDCMYLHELGDPKASFTKDEMHAGLHQVYEKKLHNQLLQVQQTNSKEEKQSNSSGNSSTSAEKGSQKDGNQSNFIPTTVVTSSHINVVNSSKCKKEAVNGGSGSGVSKEAWPSLGSSPPTDSPARTQSSPKPQHAHTVKSQENGTSESSSPTQQTQSAAQRNNNENSNHTDNSKTNRHSKDNSNSSTNGQNSKKCKDKSKQKNTNSHNNIHNESNEIETNEIDNKSTADTQTTQSNSVFTDSETQQQNYLSNELDELESDRHSLLENHDLLDNSDHSLLDDDNTHNLLNDANNEVLMMQRHSEMLAGLVDNTHLLPQMKSNMVNGYGLLLDRDTMIANDRQISQINQSLMDHKELLLRERSRSEMLMRQNEMLARQHNVIVDNKHYLPTSSIGLESASELLGANYHPNPNMLHTFGMRVDNSMGNMGTMASTMSTNSLCANSMSAMSLGAGGLGGVNALPSFLLHNQQLLQQSQQQVPQTSMVNGFDVQHTTSEGRYLAENMDKFFTDFHKAQQMRLSHALNSEERRYVEPHHYPQNMLSAERLEMEHKQRINNMRGNDGVNSGLAAGDGDDDLDFDPFKETQKAFAEMIENEMMQNPVSSGDNMECVRRSRLPPPGFSHAAGYGARGHSHHTGFTTNNATYSDWTQMDPAIMSTSMNFKGTGAGVGTATAASGAGSSLSPQQQELFARFNQLGVGGGQPNGVSKLQLPVGGPQWPAHKLPWASPYQMPLPPGFTPAKASQLPTECIDAK